MTKIKQPNKQWINGAIDQNLRNPIYTFITKQRKKVGPRSFSNAHKQRLHCYSPRNSIQKKVVGRCIERVNKVRENQRHQHQDVRNPLVYGGACFHTKLQNYKIKNPINPCPNLKERPRLCGFNQRRIEKKRRMRRERSREIGNVDTVASGSGSGSGGGGVNEWRKNEEDESEEGEEAGENPRSRIGGRHWWWSPSPKEQIEWKLRSKSKVEEGERREKESSGAEDNVVISFYK